MISDGNVSEKSLSLAAGRRGSRGRSILAALFYFLIMRGWESVALPRMIAVIERGIAAGLHSGAQFYVSRDGVIVASGAVGEARPGVAMMGENILIWYSAGKPLTAIAIAKLNEAGLVGLDEAVAKYIPEFGVKGKEAISVRNLLTHTGGIRWANFQPGMGWEEILGRICDAPLEPRWEIGRTAGYHAADELVRFGGDCESGGSRGAGV